MATNAVSVFTSSLRVSAIQHGPEGRAYARRSNVRPCRTRFAGSVSQKRNIRTSWVPLVRRRAAYCLLHIRLSGVPHQMRSSDLRGQFRYEIACAHGQVLQSLYSNDSAVVYRCLLNDSRKLGQRRIQVSPVIGEFSIQVINHLDK
jgi:hypothetical protein